MKPKALKFPLSLSLNALLLLGSSLLAPLPIASAQGGKPAKSRFAAATPAQQLSSCSEVINRDIPVSLPQTMPQPFKYCMCWFIYSVRSFAVAPGTHARLPVPDLATYPH